MQSPFISNDDVVPVELPLSDLRRPNRHNRRAERAKAFRVSYRGETRKVSFTRDRGERPHQMDAGDSYGYRTLHPTKGWRGYSERRIDNRNATQAKLTGVMPWWAGVSALAERAARG